MARAMKDSGVEWIGEIPEGWEADSLKRHFSIISGATPKSENSAFWDGDIPWITPADFKTSDKFVSHGKRNLTRAGYDSCGTSLIPKGSIVFSKRAPVGTVAIANNELCTNQGCLSCVVKDHSVPSFYYYAMSVFTEQFELVSTGTTFKEIAADVFANFRLPAPSTVDQQKIADYLDTECAQIDAVIEQTRASIEEYRKLKQSVITQAVTKGIRPGRKMKDSGVEWIGEIPEEWNVLKTKWLLDERNERSEDGLEEPLSMSQKYGLIPTKEMDMVPNMASSFVGAKVCYPGDLVFNKLKAHLGVFALSRFHGLVSPDYAVYRSCGIANLKYLEFLFKTPQYIAEFKKKSTGVGAGLTRLYTAGLYSIYSIIPPLSEQAEIVDYLDEKTEEIHALIRQKEAIITELESYKKSLIFEYVTGKKEIPK